jgi:hypothetical protein
MSLCLEDDGTLRWLGARREGLQAPYQAANNTLKLYGGMPSPLQAYPEGSRSALVFPPIMNPS